MASIAAIQPFSTPGDTDLIIRATPRPNTCLLTLNRPSKRNALSQALITSLLDSLSHADAEPDISVIIITGACSVFSAGADLQEIVELDAVKARQTRYLENLCHGLAKVRKPVIAAVESLALGGGFELALMCDMIVASKNAMFGFPEVNVGLIPGAGGTQRLTSIIGKYRATKIILSGEPMSTSQAEQCGLITMTSEPGQALTDALALASKIASKSSSAVALAKEAIQQTDETGLNLDFERNLYYCAFGTLDKEEGVKAFLERRSPVWGRYH